MRSRYVYHIIDAAGVTRYVGCSVNPYARLRSHLSGAVCGAKYGFPAAYLFPRWLWMELVAGRVPSVRIVQIAGADWRADERAETHRLLAAGAPLLNGVVKGFPRPRAPRTGRTRRMVESQVSRDEIRRGTAAVGLRPNGV